MLKDFPLMMSITAYDAMDDISMNQFKDDVYTKLNEEHGPVIKTDFELQDDKLIIHNIVELREDSPYYKKEDAQ